MPRPRKRHAPIAFRPVNIDDISDQRPTAENEVQPSIGVNPRQFGIDGAQLNFETGAVEDTENDNITLEVETVSADSDIDSLVSEDAGELEPPFQVPTEYQYESFCTLENPVFRIKKYPLPKQPRRKLDPKTRLEA